MAIFIPLSGSPTHTHTRTLGSFSYISASRPAADNMLAIEPLFLFNPGFCRALKLSPPQQVAVGLGLSRSANAAVAKEGVKFLVARVPGLVGGGGGGGGGAGAGGQLSLEALHSVLELVNSSEEVSAQVMETRSVSLQQSGGQCLWLVEHLMNFCVVGLVGALLVQGMAADR